MQDLGRAALALAFVLVVYAAVGGGLGAYTRRRRLVANGRLGGGVLVQALDVFVPLPGDALGWDEVEPD